MKKFFPILFFVAVSFLAGCCVFRNVRHPTTEKNAMVENLKSSTVAFVHTQSTGEALAWCAGVWIDYDKVLTAEHCVRAPVEELVSQLHTNSDEEAENLIETLEDGFSIPYMVYDEAGEAYHAPKKIHKLHVIKHDKYHDLALLQVSDYNDIPKHNVAKLATTEPIAGDDLHIMGHPIGLTWTYMKGTIAAVRSLDFDLVGVVGPFIHIVGPVWKGNSGGGAFNSNGELVGIASFVVPAPSESMFIHISSINNFLNIKS